jgi:hypothetical protein
MDKSTKIGKTDIGKTDKLTGLFFLDNNAWIGEKNKCPLPLSLLVTEELLSGSSILKPI